MNSLTSLDLANAMVADAERHWLYGHPYRSEPRRHVYAGVRHDARAPGRLASFRSRRGARALAAQRGVST
jgi:hypothetical protein